mgnify:CR=1 FL=1
MSLQLIQEYHHKVQEILQYGGSRNETAIRPAFQKLLEQYCADKKIELILELEYRTALGTVVNPDGTLKDAFRQDWGYWESKDQKDTLDDEIRKKLAKGYPTTNILFEDGRTAVLIRNGRELQRASFEDHAALRCADSGCLAPVLICGLRFIGLRQSPCSIHSSAAVVFLSPSNHAMTTASPQSVERPSRSQILSFASIRMPFGVGSKVGAVRSATSW